MELITLFFGSPMTMLFMTLAVVCLIMGLRSQKNIGRIPKNHTSVDFPVPSVAFPFEPLTELAEECARKVDAFPLNSIPPIMICPAACIPNNLDAVYHPGNNHGYFKDIYANAASPESLTQTMTKVILHAWLWQNRDALLGDLKIDDRTFEACHEVAAALVGLKKKPEVYLQANA